MRRLWARLVDAVLGHRCGLGCGQRVFVRDIELHYYIEHAADVRP